MKTSDLINSATRVFYKVGFKFKKHSPEILIAAGIAGTVTSAVMACKATTKASDILDETRVNLAIIHEASEEHSDEYTDKDKTKDTTLVYFQTGVKFAKLYGPAIILGAISMSCILASNNILRKRNIALAAAYATVDKGFKEYRSRVVDRFGEELDKELRYDIKAKEVEEVVVDKKGKEKIEKKTIDVIDPNNVSGYAKFFDEYCKGWSKDPETNLAFLKTTQSFANKKLQTQGYLFLNDVYEMIGLPKTQAGQVVGWLYDEKNPIGDNFIDFGIYDLDNERKRAFVNGLERSILLDFNVDGDIVNGPVSAF